MSILSTAVAGAWKVGAIAALLLAAGAGSGWVLAAHDRDVARSYLREAQDENKGLASAIHDQNIAVAGMAAATADAGAPRGCRQSCRRRHRAQHLACQRSFGQ